MNLWMQQPLNMPPGQQRGAVLVMVVIAMAAMLLMAAMGPDGGH